MPTEIRMPQLSDTMDSGKIISWFKKEGDPIDRGDILAEVETDKANLEIESFHQGTLLKIVTPADQSAAVGEVIAYIGSAGEAVPDENPKAAASPVPAPAQSAGSNGSTSHTPIEADSIPSAPQVKAQPLASADSLSSGVSLGGSTGESATSESDLSSGRVKASPLAKKMAEAKGIDLSQVSGTGPDGRVVKRDIEQLVGLQLVESKTSPSQTHSAPTPAAPPSMTPTVSSTRATLATGPVQGSLEPMSKMRGTIASRMQQSVTEAPHFYVTASIDMTEAMRTRKKLKELPQFEGLSINHFIIKAAAYAISQEPRVNRAVRDGNMIFSPAEINIGIITAVEDGLLIPVLRQVNQMNLVDVVVEARAAVQRARAGRPSSTDLTGGTFSISNMGMFDVENFTAIINPGQGSVLAVSSIREEPVVANGQITIGQRMKATISVDHRIIDGVMAGNFLAAFSAALETPALLMI